MTTKLSDDSLLVALGILFGDVSIEQQARVIRMALRLNPALDKQCAMLALNEMMGGLREQERLAMREHAVRGGKVGVS